MIFVDTSAWYARYVPRDANHAAVVAFHRSNREPMVTTDYVVDETLTLLQARQNHQRARLVGRTLLTGSLATLVWVQPDDVYAGWDVFERFGDKRWSFTDCVSYVVIQRLGIRQALSFDEHFRRFGTVAVLP